MEARNAKRMDLAASQTGKLGGLRCRAKKGGMAKNIENTQYLGLRISSLRLGV